MTTLLDGKDIASRIMEKLRENFSSIEEEYGVRASLRLILVGGDDAAAIYAKAKLKRAKRLNVDAKLLKFPEETSMKELISEITSLSSDRDVNGIMIENPLPKGLDFYSLADTIPYYKDVDGTSSRNQGLIVNRREFMTPATAAAVVAIMEHYNLSGKVTIINRSPVVGRPLINMLLNRNNTVSVCHSKTPDLLEYTRIADVVVVAIGKPLFFGKSYFTERSSVIDVGINYVEDSIKGDADFTELNGYVEAITPVPGGVGPVTASLIFENLYKGTLFQLKGNSKKL